MRSTNKRMLHDICGSLQEAVRDLEDVYTDEIDRYCNEEDDLGDIVDAISAAKEAIAHLEWII